MYKRRLAQLARRAAQEPPPDSLDDTLRQCIAFCYGVTTEWAPHVRVTVYADNPTEHQTNVPVYDTLRVTWGLHTGKGLDTRCRPIAGTDVGGGRVKASPFWAQTVRVGSRKLLYRDLIHSLLRWFLDLLEGDTRKQLLVNIILQLHEACYNCIGRHKEVFEYCMYDLIDAEESAAESGSGGGPVVGNTPVDAEEQHAFGARRAVAHHAARFLDRHKRDALHGAVLSPLKFLYRDRYEVFENLDSHGTSFWSAVFADVFFPDLELPFESIVDLDMGWTWGATDFIPVLVQSEAGIALLAHFSAVENLGRDWRSMSREVSLPADAFRQVRRRSMPGAQSSFRLTLAEAQRPGSELRAALGPYAERFAGLLAQRVVLRRCALAFVGSERWDAELGPALAALSREALGTQLNPLQVRERLCGDCADAGGIAVDEGAFAALLRAAGVAWA